MNGQPAAGPLDNLGDYAERLRRLHNRVRPRLDPADQDEMFQLTISIGLAARQQARNDAEGGTP